MCQFFYNMICQKKFFFHLGLISFVLVSSDKPTMQHLKGKSCVNPGSLLAEVPDLNKTYIFERKKFNFCLAMFPQDTYEFPQKNSAHSVQPFGQLYRIYIYI